MSARAQARGAIGLLLAAILLLAWAAPLAAAPHGSFYPAPGAGGGGGPAPVPGLPPIPGLPTSPLGPSMPGGPLSPLGIGLTFDETLWSWWWTFNRHPYLEVKRRVHAVGRETGGEDFFLGDGELANEATLRPSRSLVHETVLPRLLEVLAAEKNPDLLTAALIAVAKIGQADESWPSPPLWQVIEPFLASGSQEVAETAAIALGILGHEASAPLLSDLLHDTQRGRAGIGRKEVPYRTRAFAAYGLGLLGRRSEREDVRRYVVHNLTRALERDDTASVDLACACVIAVGLVPIERSRRPASEPGRERPPSASREDLVAWLVEIFVDRRRHDWVRAHAATSLGRLAALPDSRGDLHGAIARLLLDPLRPGTRDPQQLSRACALALGSLADTDEDLLDREVRSALLAAQRGFSDQPVRNFALISLGRIGARSGAGPEHQTGRAQIRSHLLWNLAGGKTTQQPWAALALGLFSHELHQQRLAMDAGLPRALRHAVQHERNPELLAASSLALGLTRDPDGALLLRRELGGTSQDRIRSFIAVGLGLAGDLDSVGPLRDLLEASRYRPELLARTSEALGILGDKQAVPLLVEMLAEAKALSSRAAIAGGLGLIGDARSVEPLLEMLTRDTLTETTRAFAAVALGKICDKDDLPWNEPIASGVQYLAAPESLYDQLGKGLLNIL